jgi:hypothetical protein
LSEILTFQLSPDPNPQGDVKDLLCILMAPIERGGIFGVSGNGQVQLRVRKEAQKAEGSTLGRVDGMDVSYIVQVLETTFTYFDCPGCVAVI